MAALRLECPQLVARGALRSDLRFLAFLRRVVQRKRHRPGAGHDLLSQPVFDDRAVNVTRPLFANLLVLRSEQLNCFTCQFRILREAHR